MVLVDISLIKEHLARITIDTIYFVGEGEALCLQDAIYDLIINHNVSNARPPDETDSRLG